MMMSHDDDDNGCGDGGWINLILEGVYYLTLAEIHVLLQLSLNSRSDGSFVNKFNWSI